MLTTCIARLTPVITQIIHLNVFGKVSDGIKITYCRFVNGTKRDVIMHFLLWMQTHNLPTTIPSNDIHFGIIIINLENLLSRKEVVSLLLILK
jgi:hypothetical protein